jgi:hypothetical protein
MTGWRKRKIANMVDADMMTDNEIEYAEQVTLDSALNFVLGHNDWNKDEFTRLECDYNGYDHDLVWLLTRVLFGPAVVAVTTGKVV